MSYQQNIGVMSLPPAPLLTLIQLYLFKMLSRAIRPSQEDQTKSSPTYYLFVCYLNFCYLSIFMIKSLVHLLGDL